jgi:hypothetical protein
MVRPSWTSRASANDAAGSLRRRRGPSRPSKRWPSGRRGGGPAPERSPPAPPWTSTRWPSCSPCSRPSRAVALVLAVEAVAQLRSARLRRRGGLVLAVEAVAQLRSARLRRRGGLVLAVEAVAQLRRRGGPRARARRRGRTSSGALRAPRWTSRSSSCPPSRRNRSPCSPPAPRWTSRARLVLARDRRGGGPAPERSPPATPWTSTRWPSCSACSRPSRAVALVLAVEAVAQLRSARLRRRRGPRRGGPRARRARGRRGGGPRARRRGGGPAPARSPPATRWTSTRWTRSGRCSSTSPACGPVASLPSGPCFASPEAERRSLLAVLAVAVLVRRRSAGRSS